MGSGKSFNLPEIDDTRSSGKEETFNKILERVKSSGGEITLDETHPLYYDIDDQELETGFEREIEFTLNQKEFRLVRVTENFRIQGSGRQKHLEELPQPRVQLNLKIKVGYGDDDWKAIDIDALA